MARSDAGDNRGTGAAGAQHAGGSGPREVALLILVGLLALTTCLYLALAILAGRCELARFLGTYGILFALYILAVALVLKAGARLRTPALVIVIAFAIAFRVVLLPTSPLFNDAMHRYLWDGKVLAHGISPYIATPSTPEFEYLWGPHHDEIPYPNEGSAYPPLTEIACGLAALCSPDNPVAIKGISVAFDLLTIWPILLLLDTFDRPRALALIYAWNPLVLKEFANSGHLDPIAIFFLVMGLAMCLRAKSTAAGILWGLSAGSKLFALLMPWVAWNRARLRAAVLTGVVFAVIVAPFVLAGKHGGRGLLDFSLAVDFNSGLYWFVRKLVERAVGDVDVAQKVTRAVLGAIIGMAAYTMNPANADDREIARRTGMLIACLLLISPIVNPWYVCWLAPFLCLIVSPSWIVFTGLVALSYVAYVGSAWGDVARVVEYVVFWALLVWEGGWHRRLDGPLISLTPGPAESR